MSFKRVSTVLHAERAQWSSAPFSHFHWGHQPQSYTGITPNISKYMHMHASVCESNSNRAIWIFQRHLLATHVNTHKQAQHTYTESLCCKAPWFRQSFRTMWCTYCCRATVLSKLWYVFEFVASHSPVSAAHNDFTCSLFKRAKSLPVLFTPSQYSPAFTTRY